MTDSLKPYLDPEFNPQNAESPIIYNENKNTFKIFYDGKALSRATILNILIKNFNLNITAYTQPKASKLERIYSEMIIDEEVDQRRIKKKWWRKKIGKN